MQNSVEQIDVGAWFKMKRAYEEDQARRRRNEIFRNGMKPIPADERFPRVDQFDVGAGRFTWLDGKDVPQLPKPKVPLVDAVSTRSMPSTEPLKFPEIPIPLK